MPNGRNSNWTDEKIDTLKKLWADGMSASCIAGELGYFTRSAVIGKVHRLGLDYRKTVKIREGGVTIPAFGARPQRRSSNGSKRITRRKHKNYSVMQHFCGNPDLIEQSEFEADIRAELYASEVVDLTDEQRATAVTFEQLDKQHCKWGYGDPRKPDFVFCGCDRVIGGPYCEPHMRISSNGVRAA